MTARKIRVEVFDGEGNRYTISFEGHVTREKTVQLLDLIELLGGISGDATQSKDMVSDVSKFEQVRFVVERHFPVVWFSSRDVHACYEQEFQQPISLSTVSTYLARMSDRGYLSRGGSANNRQYKLTLKKALKCVTDK